MRRSRKRIILCRWCGAPVWCPEHGTRYIVEEDADGVPVYYCERCVIEYETAGGAVVHTHIWDILKYIAEHIDEALEYLVGGGKDANLANSVDGEGDGSVIHT